MKQNVVIEFVQSVGAHTHSVSVQNLRRSISLLIYPTVTLLHLLIQNTNSSTYYVYINVAVEIVVIICSPSML